MSLRRIIAKIPNINRDPAKTNTNPQQTVKSILVVHANTVSTIVRPMVINAAIITILGSSTDAQA